MGQLTKTNREIEDLNALICTAKRLVLKLLEYCIDTRQISTLNAMNVTKKNANKKNIHCYSNKPSKSELEIFLCCKYPLILRAIAKIC